VTKRNERVPPKHIRRTEVTVYRPDRWVVLRARTSEYYGEGFDLRVEDRPKSSGFWLTVEDMTTNERVETRHETLEEAKRHAFEVTGLRALPWRKR
jgi:hypothetical protein